MELTWASGINLYAAIFVLGWLGGNDKLGQSTEVLATRFRKLIMKKPPKSHNQRYTIKRDSENNNSN